MPRTPPVYAAFDIESTDWTDFLTAAVTTPDGNATCRSVHALVDALARLARPGTVYWAHNLGGYDVKFVLIELLRRYDLRFRFVKDRIVRLSAYRGKRKLFELRDSFPVLPASLDRLARSFGTELKGGLDRTRLQDYPIEQVEAYCVADCRILMTVMERARALFGVQDFRLTAASESFREWSADGVPSGLYTPTRRDAYIRQALYGGRVEVFKRQSGVGQIYDVRSEYPAMMRNKEYPSGRVMRTASWVPGKLGIYTVEVTAPNGMHVPLLPHRVDGKLLFPTGSWVGTYCSPELEKARALGYRVRVLDGIVWSGRCSPFAAYVDKWFAMKDKADREGDAAMRYVAKLRLNTLFGKTAQRRVHTQLVHDPSIQDVLAARTTELFADLKLYLVEEEDDAPYVLTHLGAFVLCYGRLHLYSFLERVPPGELYYCDTDSVATTATLPTSPELGGLELQDQYEAAVFLAPKLYAYKGEQETVKAKGMRRDALSYERLLGALLRGEELSSATGGLMGLREASRRHCPVLQRRELVRTYRGAFTKREVLQDGIHTIPIHIQEDINA